MSSNHFSIARDLNEAAPRASFRAITWNLRKAKGGWRGFATPDAIARAIQERGPDLVLCQEVFHGSGRDDTHQSRDIARVLSFPAVYGANAVYSKGHHGNATLTRFAVLESRNFDLSTNPLERRGLLWSRVESGGGILHVFNTHLGLNSRQRRRQIDRIGAILREVAGTVSPLLLAGDFNDWSGRLNRSVRESLGLSSSMESLARKDHASYPNLRPTFALDRLYWRGLALASVRVLREEPWRGLSDHLPIEAEFTPTRAS